MPLHGSGQSSAAGCKTLATFQTAWSPGTVPFRFWLENPQPQRVLYFTKDAPFRTYTEELRRQLPPIAAIAHSGLPSPRSLGSIVRIAGLLKCPLFFVGDLDPADLSIYAALRCGTPDLVRSKKPGLLIRYLGIGGSRFRRLLDRVPNNFWISMDKAERSHFDLIQYVYPHLAKMIGSREVKELREGRKLEVEGFVNAPKNGVAKFLRLLDL